MAKSKKLKSKDIIDSYMQYLLENDAQPKNMYQFAKKLDIKESKLYEHFTSFEAIEMASFHLIMANTLDLLKKDPAYVDYDAKNKLLSFYYTFFELLKANRTYVLKVLDIKSKNMKSMRILSGLRNHFKEFVSDLDIETMELKNEKLDKIKSKGFKELAWNQFMATLYYWIQDNSPSFEKTDLFIEKSLNASFDLIDIKPIQSIMDLGKFLIKDKMSF